VQGVLTKKKGDFVLNRIFHRKRQMSGQSQGQIAYHNDDNNNNQQGIRRLILSESWALNEAGKLEGVDIKDFTESNDTKLTLFSDNINKAIMPIDA